MNFSSGWIMFDDGCALLVVFLFGVSNVDLFWLRLALHVGWIVLVIYGKFYFNVQSKPLE